MSETYNHLINNPTERYFNPLLTIDAFDFEKIVSETFDRSYSLRIGKYEHLAESSHITVNLHSRFSEEAWVNEKKILENWLTVDWHSSGDLLDKMLYRAMSPSPHIISLELLKRRVILRHNFIINLPAIAGT